jgi:hypothetical protein
LYLTIAIVALPVFLAAAVVLVSKADSEGFSGPWEVTVTAESVLSKGHQQPAVLATVTNPGPGPVLIGLRVRKRLCPAWLGARTKTRAAWRPTRRRYRADRQTVVGVVPQGESATLSVQVTGVPRRSFSVVAVVGHYDRHLRVISVPVRVPRPHANEEAGIVPHDR